jgi:cell cycle arrest protein BUB2
MPSPVKESVPSVPHQLATTTLHPPPSPSTHRALRKLQSAHNLGAKANPLSGISQQRAQLQQQRAISPTRRKVSGAVNRSPQRGRANSDAPVVHQMNAAMAGLSRRQAPSRSHLADGMSLERLIREGPPEGDVVGGLESARYKILESGIKSESDGMVSQKPPFSPTPPPHPPSFLNHLTDLPQSSLRIYIWLILLDCPILETDAYLSLIRRGASPAYSKIRNDTFRTLTTDPLFRRRVSEASLIRLLNAIAWKLHDSKEEKGASKASAPATRQSLPHLHETPTKSGGGIGIGIGALNCPASSPAAKNRARALTLTTEGSESSVGPEPGTYVQGMNVLAAPFLYAARSEAEAFVAFHHLLTIETPGYIRGAMDGVHKGLALVDKVLAIVDSKLSLYLLSKNLSAEIYAFPSVLTLCACTPPLPEVLRLWDFLFAYGPHLNILCIVAQLMLIRNQILTSPRYVLSTRPGEMPS